MPRRLPRTAELLTDAQESRGSLEALVHAPHDRDFRWVCALRLTDGTRIDVFVHTWTGRELLAGDDGAIFRRTPSGRYKVIGPDDPSHTIIPRRWEWLEMGGYVSRDVGPEPYPDDEEELLDDDVLPVRTSTRW